MKKLAIAAIALFAFSEEGQLKAKTACRMAGEKCTFNAQCCGNRVCLSKQGNVCGAHLKVGDVCGESGECGDPNFCEKVSKNNKTKVCTAPYATGHECKHDDHCVSGTCKGNWGGVKTGKCK